MAEQEPRTEKFPLVLERNVHMEETGNDDVDRLMRRLLREIEDIDVVSAHLDDSIAPQTGTKGDAVSVGSIEVTVLPSILSALCNLVGNWIDRSQKRTVKFKREIQSLAIEFKGAPAYLYTLLVVIRKESPLVLESQGGAT